ncbi:MAG: pyrroline-5-carboxylate reductase [gamma proteobacterium endosymbiont of Lamellibrachia anaximandri]|nr:pyrroline-5-carboxylate reductase [gamma proteobacterium endosymbiont of Lamellibrachia anaximandri]MBL3617571.1 pyrroline-5-carboxylate reductase [gamma proteobacterium endosymbiont of Lamellibrachia anaximandri]
MKLNSITFIGGGNMAASLISGLVADGYDPTHITASDPNKERLAQLAANYAIRTETDNDAAVQNADIVVLAVKPQVLESVVRDLAGAIWRHQPLVISIAAGVREAALREWLGEDIALVRTMPNTPAMIQSGASGLHASENVSDIQKDQAESILRAVGLTCWVTDESQMDAVTALSGSGPAYFFLVMEAMEAAAIKMGLEAENARLLTLQTALGAARMAIESKDSPATLREKVTSPGGTTERALGILQEGGLPALFEQALNGARDRSQELSEILGGK